MASSGMLHRGAPERTNVLEELSAILHSHHRENLKSYIFSNKFQVNGKKKEL
jgi:hypothetical protein